MICKFTGQDLKNGEELGDSSILQRKSSDYWINFLVYKFRIKYFIIFISGARDYAVIQLVRSVTVQSWFYHSEKHFVIKLYHLFYGLLLWFAFYQTNYHKSIEWKKNFYPLFHFFLPWNIVIYKIYIFNINLSIQMIKYRYTSHIYLILVHNS